MIETLIEYQFEDLDTGYIDNVCVSTFQEGLRFFRRLQIQAGLEPCKNYKTTILNRYKFEV